MLTWVDATCHDGMDEATDLISRRLLGFPIKRGVENMGENNVYKAVEKYLDECLLDEMSQNMAKSYQEYHLKINVCMLKRVVQIILSEMEKDCECKQNNSNA